jgi:nephrocystin-3
MNSTYQNRSLRVFVSSTFTDMFEDRNVLEEKVFPHIRRLCQTRSVEFMAVNLFWGVPKESGTEKAVEICLIEVKNCHPYFLGFLGQRYGGIQKREKYQNLANRYEEFAWLKDYPESSITELEIYHALFREQGDKNLNQTMHFYFRDPKYADNKRNDLFAETDPIKKERLEQLKQQIREKNLPITDYQKPTDLSDLVFEHLKTVVDELFPESEIPTELERTRSSHDGFAYSRQWVYLKRETDFQRLDQHFVETNLPLVIVGESGSGKTSLLANWAFQLQEKTPNTFIIWHFIGSSAESTNLDHLLRRLFEELKSRFPLIYTQENLPTSIEELIKQLPLWLANVPEKIVLILDGLNQLEQEAQKLLWLPIFIPEKVRLYLSTLTDHSQFEILQQRKDWQSFEIALLNAQERDLIVKSILKRELGGKDLHRNHFDLIEKQPQTLNPLYLKVLLKEMQVVGEHLRLKEQLEHYLAAETISDLYIKVLQRFEESYGKESICNAMRLIWISRRGLSEHELLEILNIPQYEWLIISAAFDQVLALVNRNGLLNFYHSYLQQAVEQRYLNNEELKKTAHRDLAMYFKTQPLDERIANELPHHLFEAQHWEELKTCISSASLMSLHNNEYELLKYWRQVSNYEDMEKVYYRDRVNLLRKTHFSQRLEIYADDWKLANLLETAGRYSDITHRLRRQILKANQKRFGKQGKETATSLNNLAGLYYSMQWH